MERDGKARDKANQRTVNPHSSSSRKVGVAQENEITDSVELKFHETEWCEMWRGVK